MRSFNTPLLALEEEEAREGGRAREGEGAEERERGVASSSRSVAPSLSRDAASGKKGLRCRGLHSQRISNELSSSKSPLAFACPAWDFADCAWDLAVWAWDLARALDLVERKSGHWSSTRSLNPFPAAAFRLCTASGTWVGEKSLAPHSKVSVLESRQSELTGLEVGTNLKMLPHHDHPDPTRAASWRLTSPYSLSHYRTFHTAYPPP